MTHSHSTNNTAKVVNNVYINLQTENGHIRIERTEDSVELTEVWKSKDNEDFHHYGTARIPIRQLGNLITILQAMNPFNDTL